MDDILSGLNPVQRKQFAIPMGAAYTCRCWEWKN